MRDRSEKRAPIGSPSRHSSSPRTLLLRAGFHNAARAGELLGDPALLPFLPELLQQAQPLQGQVLRLPSRQWMQ